MPQALWIGTVALMAIAAIPLAPIAAGFLACKGVVHGFKRLFRSESAVPLAFADSFGPCRSYPTAS